MEDLFQVGVITAPHGVRGEVKVFPTTDDNARFKNLKTVLLDQGRGTRELEIEGVKFFKNMVILKFKGIDDRNDVERMRQAKLLVTRENAVELGKDEYFIADLIGIQVVSDEGEELGTISDVLQTGANETAQKICSFRQSMRVSRTWMWLRDRWKYICCRDCVKRRVDNEVSCFDAFSGYGDAGAYDKHHRESRTTEKNRY